MPQLIRKQVRAMPLDPSARQAFRTARIKEIRRGGKIAQADRFLELWTSLILMGEGSRAFRWKTHIRKIMADFIRQPLLDEAIRAAGDDAGQYLEDELSDSAQVYFELCRTDKQYGALLFGLARMQEAEIARKAAGHAAGIMKSLVLAGRPAWGDEVIRASWRGFTLAFPEYGNALPDQLGFFDPAVRQVIQEITCGTAAPGWQGPPPDCS
jgi:hypothetical protein